MSTTQENSIEKYQRVIAELRHELDAAVAREAALAEKLATRTAELTQRTSEYGERIEQQSATIDVLKVMSASPGDPQPVFDLIVTRARDLCDAYGATVYQFDGMLIHWRAATGVSDDPSVRQAVEAMYPMAPSREWGVGRAIMDRRIYRIDDLETEPGLNPALRVITAKSQVAVPLMRGDMPIGALALGSRERGGFSDSQVALLQTFAEQAVIAITSAETFRALQERTHDLQESLEYQTATSDVLKVISRSTFDLQPVLDTVAETAARLCDAEQAAIGQVEGGLAWPVASVGFPPEYDAAQRAQGRRPLDRNSPLVGHRAAFEKRPVHVHDAAAVPGYSERAVTLGKQRTSLGVPLLREGETIGTIVLARQRVDPFTDRQIELVNTFADQAVIAIENARLLTEQREALEQQTATAEVLQVINSSPGDLAPVFEALLDKALALCGAKYGFIRTYDGESFHLGAMRGIPPEHTELLKQPRRPPFTGTALERLVAGEAVVEIADVANQPGYRNIATARAMQEAGLARSMVWVALRKEHALLGFVSVFRNEPHPFSAKQTALLQSFAAQAVIAMENARLINETREALEQQTATAEVLQVINASPGDLSPVFDAMLEKALRLCDAAFGNLWTYDGEVGRLAAMCGASPEYRAELMRAGPRKPEPGNSLKHVVEGEPLVHIGDIAAEGAHHSGSAVRRMLANRAGARTVLWVPMRKDGALLGFFTIYRTEVRPFTDKQIALLENFAAQGVIAVENARLITEQREALEQQTATAEVLQVINSSPGNLPPVFDAMLEKAMRLCGAAFGSLYTYDGERFHSAAQRGVPEAYAEYRAKNPPSSHRGGPARMLHSKRFVYALDVMQDELYLAGNANVRAMVELGGIRTSLAVPLLKDDTVLGFITIYRQEVRPFSDKQIALLENFAAQAVIAMENARLLGELQERTAALAERNSEYGERIEQQSATIDVLKVMSASPGDTQPVFDLIVHRARELCNGLIVGLFEFDGMQVHARSQSGFVDPVTMQKWEAMFPMAPTGASPACRAILQKRTVHIRNADADPELAQTIRDLGVKSILAAPLMRDSVAIGATSLTAVEPGGFSDGQVALLETFAEQAVIAIGSAANFRALRERTAELTSSVAELQTLEEVLRAVNSSLDIDTVLATIINLAVQLSQADEGTIYEFDETAEVFVPKAAFGMSTERVEQLRDRRIRIGETPLGISAAMRAPLHIPDLTQTPNEAGAPELVEAGIRALLVVPLLREEKVIGGLVIRRRAAGGFGPTIPTLLQTFAGQSVLAIENARLFQELAARGEESRRARTAAEATLTDLRRTQDRLVQTEKMASLGQLTAGIAHEIKNPLNFVNNFSDLSVDLLDELHEAVAPDKLSIAADLRAEIDDTTTTLKGNLEKIVRHGRRADSIVKNMLLHSRSGPSEHRAIDLNTTVEEALNLAYHGARAETPGFSITMEKDLDPRAGTIEAFPQELVRVLLNLINNGFYAARRHANETTDSSFEPTIRLTTRNLGDRVEIRVRDNGTGIPADIKDKLFQPFFTTKPTGEGTGLGLSISYDIVTQQHGGTITVDSDVGDYTEFVVTLPRRTFARDSVGT